MKNKNNDTNITPKKSKKGLLIGIGVFLGIGIIGSAMGEPTTSNAAPAPSSTIAPTPTPTPEPTVTPTPLPTFATTEELVAFNVNEIVGEEYLREFKYDVDNDSISIVFKGEMGIGNWDIRRGMYSNIFQILKSIQNHLEVNIVKINATFDLIDKYGNETEDIVIRSIYTKEEINKINFDNVSYTDVEKWADSWWQHPALN